MNGLTLVTAPVAEPITLDEAKAHLRVEVSDDDTLITSLIKAAREHAEEFTRRRIITQTWDLSLDGFPCEREITIPYPPLQTVSSLKYTDADAVETTIVAADYVVAVAREPGRVVLKQDRFWPTVTLKEAGAVVLRFVCGYGADGASVPEPVRLSMLHLIGEWYVHRETVVTGSIVAKLPHVFEALLWPYRDLRFA